MNNGAQHIVATQLPVTGSPKKPCEDIALHRSAIFATNKTKKPLNVANIGSTLIRNKNPATMADNEAIEAIPNIKLLRKAEWIISIGEINIVYNIVCVVEEVIKKVNATSIAKTIIKAEVILPILCLLSPSVQDVSCSK